MPVSSRLVRSALITLVMGAVASASAAAQQTAPQPATGAARPVWPDEGPRTWTPRPTEAAITPNDLRTRLYQISDDSMHGRAIGTAGDYQATAYIADVFRGLGLRAAGENGGYFQNLPYGTFSLQGPAPRLTIAKKKAVGVSTRWIPLGPNASLHGVPAVFAGHFGDISVPLDTARFRGRVAVFIGGPRVPGMPAPPAPSCASLPDRFGADAAIADEARLRALRASQAANRKNTTTTVQQFARFDDRARAAGAVGELFIEPIGAGAVAAALQPFGSMPMSESAISGLLARAVIDSVTAQQIFGKPAGQLSVGDAGAPITTAWRFTFRASPTPARNVIAILPGSDPARAGEYVLMSAHNDHVGLRSESVDHDSLRAVNMVTRPQGANDPLCQPTPAQQHEIDSLIAHARSIRPPRRDSVMNGADDDGSGTVLLLEAAQKFASEHPARSIIFVSHTGEEAGLLGSRWFTDHPTIALDSVAAAINMDMEGKGHVWEVKFGGPNSVQMLGARRLSREFGDVIDSVNAVSPRAMAIDKSWDVPANPLNRFCRSDQVNYVRHHVPVVYVSTGYSLDYHQPTDEPQYVDYDHMARVGNFVHDIALAVADRRSRPVITGDDPAYPRCR